MAPSSIREMERVVETCFSPESHVLAWWRNIRSIGGIPVFVFHGLNLIVLDNSKNPSHIDLNCAGGSCVVWARDVFSVVIPWIAVVACSSVNRPRHSTP